MIIKTRGVVFRAIKYGENSLITEIYTEDQGLQKFIVNGIRGAKAKSKTSLLQVMSLLDLVIYYRKDREMHRINEMRPAYIFRGIPFDVKKGAVGLFMAEIARKTIKEPEKNTALFNFLFTTFQFLDETPHSVGNFHLSFLLNLCRYLGFAPGGCCDDRTPVFDLRQGVYVERAPGYGTFIDSETSPYLYAVQRVPLHHAHEIQMDRAIRRALLNHLLDFYRLQVENMATINSHIILQEVLNS